MEVADRCGRRVLGRYAASTGHQGILKCGIVDLVIGSPAFDIVAMGLDGAARIGRTPGDRRCSSAPASLDLVLVDSDFVTLDFSGQELAENLYSLRDRICGFPQQNDRK